MANTAGAIQRITRELAEVHRNEDLSLAVAFRDDDVRSVRALIIGPPETPYEFGFFEFDMRFPKDYPLKAPHVRCITTNSGRTRFNPNIYSEGKVCLSILGTWRGEPGEEWSGAQGLESVLLSIQSLMSANPYENEPGHEDAKKEDEAPTLYQRKIRHEAIRISIIQRLERLLKIDPDKATSKSEREAKRARFSNAAHDSPIASGTPAIKPVEANGDGPGSGSSTPSTSASAHEYDAEATYNALNPTPWDPFADLLKRRFSWYYDTYATTIANSSQEQKDGTPFQRTDFEYPPNSMEGTFQYEQLRRRLEGVRQGLEAEQDGWVRAGARQVSEGTQLATQLDFQFKQLQHQWHESRKPGSRLELGLPDKNNPFRWDLTFFGQPEHNLDEGIFALTMHIPPDFPSSQPRVAFATPIFHHRVSATTCTLCYFPDNEESLTSHLDAIIAAIEDKDPKFDPRATVNPEASSLLWGRDDQKKLYKRKLRRSAQASTDF